MYYSWHGRLASIWCSIDKQSHHLVRQYVWIFVGRHNFFWVANMFLRAMHEKNCEKLRNQWSPKTNKVLVKISVHQMGIAMHIILQISPDVLQFYQSHASKIIWWILIMVILCWWIKMIIYLRCGKNRLN